MGIKKKLGLGAMSAVMGISLIGTGTWAAFNDIEKVDAQVAAGELNLKLSELENGPIDFKISDLKPGDHMTRNIKLVNDGTLAIKDVLMSIEGVEFTDYAPTKEDEAGYEDDDTWGENNALEYLNQFRVSVMKVGAEGDGSGDFPHPIISGDADIRLGDFYLASGSLDNSAKTTEKIGGTTDLINTAKSTVWDNVDRNYIDEVSQRINAATVNPDKWTGLPLFPEDDDNLQIKIEFVKDDTDSDKDGTHDQNKFQGDTASINVQFEARQWGGQEITDEDVNTKGYIETNEQANNGN
jgi:spore coat-associated protein N